MEAKSKSSDPNNNNIRLKDKTSGKKYEKYSLRPRSIQNRIETECRGKDSKKKKSPKPKERPPPLSKYRRKTANARERGRMQEINYAFECLQNVVPQYALLQATSMGKPCEKLTKITTLRLAMAYIEALKDMLSGNSATTTTSTSNDCGSFDFDSPDYNLSSSLQMMPMELSDNSSTDSFLSAAANLVPLLMNSNNPVKCGGTSNSNNFVSTQPAVPKKQFSSIGSPMEIQKSPPPVLSSSYTVSVSSPGPDCIQTVMRGIVSPSNAVAAPTTIQMQHFPPLSVPSPSACSSSSQSSASSMSSNGSSVGTPAVKLPSISSTFLKKSMSSFILDCTKLTSGRAGSLSSLGESDLSEYASDLLSDEGSSTCLELDDPLFQDIIGSAESMRPSELDILLESESESLHLHSDFSDT